MDKNDKERFLDSLKTAEIYAGAEFERLCNENQYIDACIFASIKNSLHQNIILLIDYVICKGETERVAHDDK